MADLNDHGKYEYNDGNYIVGGEQLDSGVAEFDISMMSQRVNFRVEDTSQKAVYALSVANQPTIVEQLKSFNGDIYDMLMFLDGKLGARTGIKDKIMKISKKIMDLEEDGLKDKDSAEEITRKIFNIITKIKYADNIQIFLEKEYKIEEEDAESITKVLCEVFNEIKVILDSLNFSDIFKQHNEVKSVEDLAKAYEKYKNASIVYFMTDKNVLDDILDKGIRNNIISLIEETNCWKNGAKNGETIIRHKINLLLISYFLNREIDYKILDELKLNKQNRRRVIKTLKDNIK